MDTRADIAANMPGKTVRIQVDRPLGYCHKGLVYPINYGFIPGLIAGDGEEQDVYILGIDEPLADFEGRIIAVVRRLNDCEDKLVAAPEGMTFTKEQIAQAVHFQERFFETELLLWEGCKE